MVRFVDVTRVCARARGVGEGEGGDEAAARRRRRAPTTGVEGSFVELAFELGENLVLGDLGVRVWWERRRWGAVRAGVAGRRVPGGSGGVGAGRGVAVIDGFVRREVVVVSVSSVFVVSVSVVFVSVSTTVVSAAMVLAPVLAPVVSTSSVVSAPMAVVSIVVMPSTVASVMTVGSTSTFVASRLLVTIFSTPMTPILALLLATTPSLRFDLAEVARTHDGEGSSLT